MSRSRSPLAALARALAVATMSAVAVATMSAVAVIAAAGSSFAAESVEVNAGTTSTPVSSGPVIAGLPMGTFTWALVGFLVLVASFLAASRSGRRTTAPRPAGNGADAVNSFHASTRVELAEQTTASVTV